MGARYLTIRFRDRPRRWIDGWKDLVDFEVIPVVRSADAARAVAPRL